MAARGRSYAASGSSSVGSVPDYRLAFYSSANRDFHRIEPILEFARTHREGRYLVEQIPYSAVGPALDARALSAYLGMQGNDSPSFVYREAPISSEFLYPIAGVFSSGRDAYALSSILAEDAAFFRQDPRVHLGQAGIYRVRYFVLETEPAKTRMARLAPERFNRYDFGVWSVFELKSQDLAAAEPMPMKPVLVLTMFTAKAARQSDFNFLRLAEEDFVIPPLLPTVFGPGYSADVLPDPSGFGALVIDAYRYRDPTSAFRQVQAFSRHTPVVLVESNDALFRMLASRRSELGRVAIVPRATPSSDRWIGAGRPLNYGRDSVRITWMNVKAALRQVLEREPSAPPDCSAAWGNASLRIRCGGGRPQGVVINSSFHPNWRAADGAADGAAVLMLNPSLTYTTVRGETVLEFRRTALERAALAVSGIAFAAVLFMIPGRRAKRPR